MRILDPTIISNTKQFPVKKGTLTFLQDAYKETLSAILQAIIGVNNYNGAKVYILYGCVNSGTYPIYSITAGAVFFLGEIFFVDAASFTASGSNVAVFSVVTTQYTGAAADPVTFTDGTVNSVHNIRKMLIAQGASGSTLFAGSGDYTDGIFYRFDLDDYVNAQVLVETTRAQTIEFALLAAINTINGAWTLRSNIADIVKAGGDGTIVVNNSNIKYKVIGKTVHLQFTFDTTQSGGTANAVKYTMLIPGALSRIVADFNKYIPVFISDSTVAVLGYAAFRTVGDASHIEIFPASALTANVIVSVSGELTFEIA